MGERRKKEAMMLLFLHCHFSKVSVFGFRQLMVPGKRTDVDIAGLRAEKDRQQGVLMLNPRTVQNLANGNACKRRRG